MNGKRPRILHLVPEDGIGGVEVAARSMRDRDDLPLPFKLLFIRQGRSEEGWLAANRRAYARARAFAPDLVLCSLWRSVPLALILTRRPHDPRFVLFVHAAAAVHPVDSILSRIAMRRAEAIWGDSAATLSTPRLPSRVATRSISFVTQRMNPIADAVPGPRFVSWGRLNHLKGIDRAIRIVAMLVARGIEATYDVYGPDDGALSELSALVSRLSMADHVRFLGPVDRVDLPRISMRYAFFLQLSRMEGMCMAAVEAMQLGLVPIVTPVGEMARYVTPGDTGLHVDVVRLEDACDAISAALDDPAAVSRMAERARRHWSNAPLYSDDVCAAAASLFAAGPKRAD